MAGRYFLELLSTRDAHLRAADADRERAAERLRESHAEGRLDLDEFQQRLERCYESKTFGELDSLLSDLPRQPTREERRVAGISRRFRLAALVAAAFVLAIVSAVAAHHHAFFLWVPLLFLFWRVSWWRRGRWFTGPRRRPWDA